MQQPLEFAMDGGQKACRCRFRCFACDIGPDLGKVSLSSVRQAEGVRGLIAFSRA